MKTSLFLATALAAGLILAAPLSAQQSNQRDSQQSGRSGVTTQEEARAALMMPSPKQPSTGEASGMSGTATAGQGSGMSGTATTGAADPAAAEPPPSGPIGSFGQTIPAKFSERNDILDHVPTMAFPMRLSDDQRRQIYQAVMADKTEPAAGAGALQPADELPAEQALNGMHELPSSLQSLPGLQGLKYVKSKDKVFLVLPATRIVVEQITG